MLFLLSLAVLEGVVLENQTGKPLARAEVTLEVMQGQSGGPTRVLTGADGGFRFVSLSAGTYQVTARRKGFEIGRHGQARAEDAASPIVLAEDGHFSAVLRLRRPAGISGTVLDENGVGLPGVQVVAYTTGKRGRVAASTQSDDRGRYRLWPLLAGRYAVSTGPHRLEDGTGLLPTWLGNTVERGQTRLVDAASEQDVSGADLAPISGKLAGIRGIVGGEGLSRVLLRSEYGFRETNLKIGNSFEFQGLAPGDYELSVKGNGISAWKRVRLAGEDLYVEMKAGPSPKLRVHCRSEGGKAVPDGSASLFPEPRDPVEAMEVRIGCGETAALDAGEYRLRAVTASNVYLESLSVRRSADSESETFEVALDPGQVSDVILTFGGKPASVEGVVKLGEREGAPGAPVFLRALDPDLYARSGGLRFSRADAEGRFRFDGLPPGNYEAVASFRFTREREEEWSRGSGKAIRVQEGAKEAVDLELF